MAWSNIVLYWQGTAYPYGAPPSFSGVHAALSLVFRRSLFVLLSFIFCPLCRMSFFYLRILITSLWYLRFTDSDYPLVSSNSSCNTHRTRNIAKAGYSFHWNLCTKSFNWGVLYLCAMLSILSLSTTFLLDFTTVSTMWYFLFFY